MVENKYVKYFANRGFCESNGIPYEHTNIPKPKYVGFNESYKDDFCKNQSSSMFISNSQEVLMYKEGIDLLREFFKRLPEELQSKVLPSLNEINRVLHPHPISSKIREDFYEPFTPKFSKILTKARNDPRRSDRK